MFIISEQFIFSKKESLWKVRITVDPQAFSHIHKTPVIILSINANLNIVLRLRIFLAQEAHRLDVPWDFTMNVNSFANSGFGIVHEILL